MRVIESLVSSPVLFFTGLSFTFVILPLMLAAHRALPLRLRAGMLAAISGLFYFFIQPAGLPLMAVCVVLDYIAVQAMRGNDDKQEIRSLCMWFSVAKGILVILFTGLLSRSNGVPLMLGTLIYTLSGMDAVISMYKHECEYERDIVKFILYCCFFPRLFAGPLCTYSNFKEQMDNPDYSGKTFLSGFTLFMPGLFKAFVFGIGLSELYRSIAAFPESEASVLYGWTLVVTFALAVYFILCGLSEMAQGISAMFGYQLPRNFYYPYQSPSVTDFPDRFNMTLTSFIKRRPITELIIKTEHPMDLTCLLTTGILTGLWFGLELWSLLWGLYLALFMIAEKYIYGRAMEYIPSLLNRFYTLCVTIFGFIILSSGSIGEITRTARLMSGFGSENIPLYTNKIMYLLSSHWLLLVFAVFFASSLSSLALGWLKKHMPKVSLIVNGVVSASLLIVFTALSLIGGGK